jgi:DNA-directed RNA polymerase specialized sigma24 family protein
MEYLRGERFQVQLNERHLAVLLDDAPNAEEMAIAREEAAWTPSTSEPAVVARDWPAELAALVDAVLPIEEAFILRRALDGATQREIAAVCGIAQPSVHSRLRRAIRKLRRHARGEAPLKATPCKMRGPWAAGGTR